MSLDLGHIARTTAAVGPVIRVLVVQSAGSAPRDAGTSMLIWADGQSGTIGGGELEYSATQEARGMLASGGMRRHRTVPLGPALGQCCGGSVTVIWERFEKDSLPDLPYARALGPEASMPQPVARKRAMMQAGAAPALLDGWVIEAAVATPRLLWIWGAGHVGRALVHVLHPMPEFAITWVDTAPERFPASPPSDVQVIPAVDMPRLAAHGPENAEHIIVTYSHEIDLALCHALLTRGFATCGLIGSATKWARFRNRLVQLGHSRESIARIACPIGEPALGKHPAAIALGVAAGLLRQGHTIHVKEGAKGDRNTA